MIRCIASRWGVPPWMALWLACVAVSAGGCLQLTANHPPFAPKRLPDITFHVRIPEANLSERLNIAATGEVYAQSSDRGIAGGLLSDEQVAELQKIFTGWDQLPPTYASAADGPIYVIAYGGHSVTGGSLIGAPVPFQQAVGRLRQVMDGLRWKSAGNTR